METPAENLTQKPDFIVKNRLLIYLVKNSPQTPTGHGVEVGALVVNIVYKPEKQCALQKEGKASEIRLVTVGVAFIFGKGSDFNIRSDCHLEAPPRLVLWATGIL